MKKYHHTFTLLLADDDPDDCAMIREAIDHSGERCDLVTVTSSDDLFAYLRREGRYKTLPSGSLPSVILLDLHLPGSYGKDGVLRELKSDALLRRIPVIGLARAGAEDQITSGYDAGVNAVIGKPFTFPELVRTLNALVTFWLKVARLPDLSVLGISPGQTGQPSLWRRFS